MMRNEHNKNKPSITCHISDESIDRCESENQRE